MQEPQRRSKPSTPISPFHSTAGDYTTSPSSQGALSPSSEDWAYYLHALFPYATGVQVSKALKESNRLDEAAGLLYRELNPKTDDLLFMYEESERCQWETENGIKNELFVGVEAALKNRFAGMKSKPVLSVGDMHHYNSSVHILPIDTSAWDNDWLLQPTDQVLTPDFPLGTEVSDTTIQPEGNGSSSKILSFAKDIPVSAPIIRWGSAVKVRLSENGEEPRDEIDADGTIVIYSGIRRNKVIPCEPIRAYEREGSSESREEEPVDFEGITAAKINDILRHQRHIDPSEEGDLLKASGREKERLEAVALLLMPYSNFFGYKEACNVVKAVDTYCPGARVLLLKQVDAIATLLEVFLTEKQLSNGLQDVPISLPLLGKKLVTLGPIAIASLLFDKRHCSVDFSDGGHHLKLKLKIKSTSLQPISFSYISQSSAANQLLRRNFLEPRLKERTALRWNSFEKTTHGDVEVKISGMKLAARLHVLVHASGMTELRFEGTKVSIGGLKVHSSLTRINVMSTVLKPIIKFAVAKAIEEALMPVIKL